MHVLLVYPESEQSVKHIQGKPQIKLAIFLIGLSCIHCRKKHYFLKGIVWARCITGPIPIPGQAEKT